MKYLHFYAQTRSHGDAWIVGTEAGLVALRDCIDAAIQNGAASTEVFANDGEGLTALVLKASPESFEKLMLPYYDLGIGDTLSEVGPYELLGPGQYTQLVRDAKAKEDQ